MPKRLLSVSIALAAVLSLSSCSNAADAKIAAEGLAFFKSTEARCNEWAKLMGRKELPPLLFAGARTEDVFTENDLQFVQVVDGKDNLLYVNLTQKRVQAGVRPDEVMPEPYLRSCPVDLYFGISYELEKQG